MNSDNEIQLALQLENVQHWPYLPILSRVALALALGLFVGMERERRGKEAGMRTFAFASLLGCLCGFLGDSYALLGLALLSILIVFLNWQRLQTNRTAELTTSAALLVTGVMGVLCGKGHHFTPVTVGVFMAGLLALKERMTHFSIGLTEAELRSAILLGILAFVIYPVLPTKPIDPWGFLEPRSAWVTVILIAAIGFINYVLLKLYGVRGTLLAGFLAGLVNSTIAVMELAGQSSGKTGDQSGAQGSDDTIYRGVLLATAAMLLRNMVLLGILSRNVFVLGAGVPLILMLLVAAGLALWQRNLAPDTSLSAESTDNTAELACPETTTKSSVATEQTRLQSPFSLLAALKAGLLFLALHIAGMLGQRFLGVFGFYGVSLAGGLVSSATATAAAAELAIHGKINASVAGVGVIIASLASAMVNLPIVARLNPRRTLIFRLASALGAIIIAGCIGAFLQTLLVRSLGSSLLRHSFH